MILMSTVYHRCGSDEKFPKKVGIFLENFNLRTVYFNPHKNCYLSPKFSEIIFFDFETFWNDFAVSKFSQDDVVASKCV